MCGCDALTCQVSPSTTDGEQRRYYGRAGRSDCVRAWPRPGTLPPCPRFARRRGRPVECSDGTSQALTPALGEARKRRQTLHDAIVQLEMAISSPAAGRVDDWSGQVTKDMVGVRDAFDQHVIVTEKPGGLYEEIMERAPRLAGTVKRLQDEHPAIAGVDRQAARTPRGRRGRRRRVAARQGARRPPAADRLGRAPSTEGRRPRVGGVQRRHRRHRVARRRRVGSSGRVGFRPWPASRSAS